MPIYEYQCEKCGVFEATQRITERPLKHCPTCKGKVERLVSRSSFVLKGSGWYATDYARGSSSSSGSDKPGAAGSTNGSTETSESKPKPKSTETSTTTKPATSDKPAAKSSD
jgi:putative FmdB family regulatory protein